MPSEPEDLPVVTDAAQIARLREDGQRVDRPDAGDGDEQPVVGMVGEQLDRLGLGPVALIDQASPSSLGPMARTMATPGRAPSGGKHPIGTACLSLA
jgi:hypothetical protein